MDGDIKERAAHQCGQVGHRFTRVLLVVALDQTRQDLLLKLVADLDGVTEVIELGPRGIQGHTEFLHSVVPLFVSQVTRPPPLNCQRGLTPASGGLALGVSDLHLDAGAGHMGHDARAEFERHSGFDRKEVQR